MRSQADSREGGIPFFDGTRVAFHSTGLCDDVIGKPRRFRKRTTMLAIISLQFTNADDDGLDRFAEEMSAFGYRRHPHMPEVFLAEFRESVPRDDALATVCNDLTMCLGTSEADSWTGTIAITRRPSSRATTNATARAARRT